MEFIRKTIKSFALCLAIFAALTFVLAAMIQFTSFRESWAFGGLVVALSLTTMIFGRLESGITGKRGLLTGAASAVVRVFIILFISGEMFSGNAGLSGISVFYAIPVITGAAGGIAGANRTRLQ